MNNDVLIAELIKIERLIVDIEAGLVYSARSNNPCKPVGAKTQKGYLRAYITFGGAHFTFMVHRIVWIAARGIPDNARLQINHINCIKTDNRLANLEIVSNFENQQHAKKNGLLRGGRKNAQRNALGQFIGKTATGRLLDGVGHSEFPGQPIPPAKLCGDDTEAKA